MTERLYYSDSHMREFSARVVSCEPRDGQWAVILNRTAFFPGGGGQAPDGGVLGGVRVLDAREEQDEVVHLTDGPAETGARVRCAIDWDARFRRMQNHTGEHIVSGTVHRLFGWDNVGFHMGPACVTIDFSGELSPEDVHTAESVANLAVCRDLPVRAYFPAPEELADMEYRSKKPIDGAVRIVAIEGVDRCACCAPHVSRTGEVGIIRLLTAERHRGGTRLTLVCGFDALQDYRARCRAVSDISEQLSAPPLETAAAVRRVLAELETEKRRGDAARMELARLKAAALPETEGALCLFEPDMDIPPLRELVNAGMKKSRLCAAFCGAEGDWRYIVGSEREDLRALAKTLNAAVCGRGGGSAAMIEGTARASRREIERYFASL